MRVWSIKGFFYDKGQNRPVEHVLTVGSYTIDSAIDLAVEMWNRSREGIFQVERKNVYGVTQILTMDTVENDKATA